MNLTFHAVSWTGDNLMYVEFTTNEYKVRWYPKWDDLRHILELAVITEGSKSRWYSQELDKYFALFLELRDNINFFRGTSCAEELQGVEFFPRAILQTAESGDSH